MITRRNALIGIGASLIVAPSIVRATSIMKINPLLVPREIWLPCDGRQFDKRIYPELYMALGADVVPNDCIGNLVITTGIDKNPAGSLSVLLVKVDGDEV